MTEAECLIQELGEALLKGWNCRDRGKQGRECRALLDSASLDPRSAGVAQESLRAKSQLAQTYPAAIANTHQKRRENRQ